MLGDPTMYTMLHRAEVEWPCLSFDTVQDSLGAVRWGNSWRAGSLCYSVAEEVPDDVLCCCGYAGGHCEEQ